MRVDGLRGGGWGVEGGRVREVEVEGGMGGGGGWGGGGVEGGENVEEWSVGG